MEKCHPCTTVSPVWLRINEEILGWIRKRLRGLVPKVHLLRRADCPSTHRAETEPTAIKDTRRNKSIRIDRTHGIIDFAVFYLCSSSSVSTAESSSPPPPPEKKRESEREAFIQWTVELTKKTHTAPMCFTAGNRVCRWLVSLLCTKRSISFRGSCLASIRQQSSEDECGWLRVGGRWMKTLQLKRLCFVSAGSVFVVRPHSTLLLASH